LYHIVCDGHTLRVLDSTRERFSVECLNAAIAPGHYRLPLVERFAPRTHHFGPGRIFIDLLSPRYVDELLVNEKAVMRFEHRLKFDRLPALATPTPPEDTSVHGGGERVFLPIATGATQPLTPSDRGIRVHNDELDRIMRFLEPRLRIGQLVVLSVLSKTGASTK
jgi:hypothetical protein